jgi:hypothetical protein
MTEYKEGQIPIIYLVTSVEKVIEDTSLSWCFTDGHAVESVTRYFQDWKYHNQIDWDIINAKMWRNTDSDPDKKRRKQAEFLVYNFFK